MDRVAKMGMVSERVFRHLDRRSSILRYEPIRVPVMLGKCAASNVHLDYDPISGSAQSVEEDGIGKDEI